MTVDALGTCHLVGCPTKGVVDAHVERARIAQAPGGPAWLDTRDASTSAVNIGAPTEESWARLGGVTTAEAVARAEAVGPALRRAGDALADLAGPDRTSELALLRDELEAAVAGWQTRGAQVRRAALARYLALTRPADVPTAVPNL